MGRTKTEGVQPVDLPELDAKKVSDIQELGGALMSAHSEERDLVNQMLGQAQMAGAFEDFSRTVRTSKLAYVKEIKLYKALAGKKSPDGPEILKGTWQEFCRLLGRSVDQVDEDINNLRQFGEDALESMSRMGIGYRQMRQFRKLGDDDKVALIEAAKTGDRETVQFLAEELIAKHQKEKEQLTEDLVEAKAVNETQTQILADRTRDLDQAKQDLARAQRRIQTASVDEKTKQYHMEAQGAISGLKGHFKAELRPTLDALLSHMQESGEDQTHFMATLLRDLEFEIAQLRADFDLPVYLGDEEPDWLKPGALEAANALVEREKGH